MTNSVSADNVGQRALAPSVRRRRRRLSLVLLTSMLAPLLALATMPAASAQQICLSADSDSDGDGWGWENDRSCLVVDDSSPLGECDYSQAAMFNGWGWNSVTSTSCPPEANPGDTGGTGNGDGNDSETTSPIRIAEGRDGAIGGNGIHFPNATTSQQGAGFRSHCAVSHFSYEDPIVSFGQTDSAHLHMFWGNTSTDAFSTNRASLEDSSNHLSENTESTCSDLGNYNNSAYWMPALFDQDPRTNSDAQVVLPNDINVYYKTHEAGDPAFPASSVFDNMEVIPNDLSMVSPRRSNGVSHTFLGTYINGDGNEVINVSISFHDCFQQNLASATDPQDRYDTAFVDRQTDSCPEGYSRMTRVIFNLSWIATADNGLTAGTWMFSDGSDLDNFDDLHGDYMASWSDQREELIQCNRERRACRPEAEQSNLESIRALGNNQIISSNLLIPGFATPASLVGLSMMPS